MVNVDRMLKEQRTRLTNINSEEVTSKETKKQSYALDIPENNVSRTNMFVIDNTLTLTRVICSNVYRVEFPCKTIACDIVDWFSCYDNIFVLGARRTNVKADQFYN